MHQSEIAADSLIVDIRDKVVPLIKANEAQIARYKRIPKSVLDAMMECRYFHAILPESIGGLGKHIQILTTAVSTLAAANANVGWTQMNLACSRIAGDMPQEQARKFFKPRNTAIAWGPPMDTKPTVRRLDGGGYHVKGEWKFASGSAFATWFAAHVVTPKGTRTLLVPRKAVTVINDWIDVIGLHASSSNSYKFDALVPDPFVIERDKSTVWEEKHPIFGFPSFAIAIMGPGAVARGIAQGMLDDFRKVAADIARHNTGVTIAADDFVATVVGKEKSSLKAANAYFENSIAEAHENILRFGELTADDCLNIRDFSSQLIEASYKLVLRIQRSVGSMGVYKAKYPFANRMDDMHALMGQHQASEQHFKRTMRAWLSGRDEDKRELIGAPKIQLQNG